MNQDQKAALKMTAAEVWDDIKVPVYVVLALIYFALFAIFTQGVFVATCGALGALFTWAIRKNYLNNLEYIIYKRELEERAAARLKAQAEFNLAYVKDTK